MEINSPEDLVVLKTVFKKYDTDNTNYLDLKEFTKFITTLSNSAKEIEKVSVKTAKAVFTLIDENVDGKINFQEFCRWWNTDRYEYFRGEKKKLLRKSYEIYRKYSSSSGGITPFRFEEMMEALGIEYSEELFYSMDTNSDGILSFEEFCKWLNWF